MERQNCSGSVVDQHEVHQNYTLHLHYMTLFGLRLFLSFFPFSSNFSHPLKMSALELYAVVYSVSWGCIQSCIPLLNFLFSYLYIEPPEHPFFSYTNGKGSYISFFLLSSLDCLQSSILKIQPNFLAFGHITTFALTNLAYPRNSLVSHDCCNYHFLINYQCDFLQITFWLSRLLMKTLKHVRLRKCLGKMLLTTSLFHCHLLLTGIS